MNKLKFLTWNIESQGVSFQAGGLSLPEKHEAVIEVIKEHEPDVVALQEVNSAFDELFLTSSEYIKICSATSHAGRMCMYAKPNIQVAIVSYDSQLPIVSVDITTANKKIRFSSAHLCPGKDGAYTRECQLNQITLDDTPHVLMGDLNVREAENDYIAEMGWTDATDRMDYTWNSLLNLYHRDGYKFRCRFDRILYHGLPAPTYSIIGNEPLDGNVNCYLSDHFGLNAVFTI